MSELIFREPLIINNINAVKEKLPGALNGDDNIVINHKDVEEFDLSYLQLLVSFTRYAAENGKTITYISNEAFDRCVKASGFSATNTFPGESGK